ncbi:MULTISPECIES: transporter [unclassified Mesorhizobium]|uniref:transporter n=1 Tax=unclassified Mesorhizobium TaxID=325217 RepID=UPI001FE1F018|nr:MULTISPECIES: transporter [unclassified Mesorhizobium]
MKISAAADVDPDTCEVVAPLTISVTLPFRILRAITDEAVADLALEKVKQAYAVIKASDVMVGID